MEELIETMLVEYQDAWQNMNHRKVNTLYSKICSLYNPYTFMGVWWEKYSYLYDTREDFEQEYLLKFCHALQEWKPRDSRSKSRYNGKGDFKNYFIGILSHYYSNKIKAKSAGRRNLFYICPMCNKSCGSLSIHILEKHMNDLVSYINGIDIISADKCPFCSNLKIKKDGLSKHIETKHSTILFEKFKDMYPGYNINSPKIISNILDDDAFGEDKDIYECISDNNKLNCILDSNLNDIQKKILDSIFIKRVNKVKYDEKTYNCSLIDFNDALNDLGDKMVLFGMEG